MLYLVYRIRLQCCEDLLVSLSQADLQSEAYKADMQLGDVDAVNIWPVSLNFAVSQLFR